MQFLRTFVFASGVLSVLLSVPSMAQMADPLAERFRPSPAPPLKSDAVSAAISGPVVWATDSLAKVQPTGSAGTGSSINLSAARNEFESFQVHVLAGASPVQMNVTVSDFINVQTGQLLPAVQSVAVFREAYLTVTTPSDLNGITGLVPDPLVPVRDAYFHEPRNAFPTTIPANTIRSAWIDVFVPPGTTSGYYVANVTVLDGTNTIGIIPVQLTVWNFELPSTATLKTAFAMGYGSLADPAYGSYMNAGAYPGAGGNYLLGLALIHSAVAQFFLDHRVSIWTTVLTQTFPSGQWNQFDSIYGPLFSGTASTILPGAQMSVIDYNNWAPPTVNTADVQDWMTHFTQKGWASRLAVGMCDEPPAGCSWSNLAAEGTAFNTAAPGLARAVTTDINKATLNGVLNDIDILSPLVSSIQPMGGQSTRSAYNTWLTSPGKQLWWYQSCDEHESCANGSPGPVTSTWPSYMIDAAPVRNRIFQWLAYLYQIQGELYYDTDNWGDSPWSFLYFAGGNGEGVFYYPGTADQIGGSTPVPVASLRLKLVRDGMEDYEYLYALSQAGYGSLAQGVSQSFITNAYTFSNDPQQLQSARQTLGSQLHLLSLQPPPFTITSLNPPSLAVQGGTSLTVNGTNFAPGDAIRWSSPSSGGEIGLATTFVSTTQLTATVSASLLSAPGTATVTVRRSPVLAATASLLIVPNVPTTLGAVIAGKSGPNNARVWTIQFTNNGPGVATVVQISSFTLAQTAGAACTPVVGTLPPPIASIAPGATATAPVTINFGSCTGTVRFRVTMPYTANGGAVTGTMTSNNQVP